MTDTMTKTGNAALLRGALAVGAGAALLAARGTQAQAAAPAKLTLYFTTDPKLAGATSVAIPGTGDIKVLNFALALETLEAELYRQAYTRLTGTTPDGSAPVDMFGTAITSLGVAPTDADAAYLKTFAAVEANHRDFLTAQLKGNWVTTAGAKFDFGINSLDRVGVVKLVYAAELTGVSAYLGGITPGGLVIGSPYLAIAASILGTEARHTATVAILLNGPLFNVTPKIETAPLANENTGRDQFLSPDVILYLGGTVPAGLTPGGRINGVSGPNGFVVM